MEWRDIGARIRRQREYMEYTREQLAELIEVTPKFCSDIELGVKGMSVPTLCRISEVLHISTDYILFGTTEDCQDDTGPLYQLVSNMPTRSRSYAEQFLQTFVIAMDAKKISPSLS